MFALAAVGVQMVLGFALALMTTKVTRGRVFYRTVFILPILVPGIVIGAIWKLMYSFDFGVLNQMLGVRRRAARSTGSAIRRRRSLAVIAVDVWHWTPFVFLLLLAGLESLPQDIYEAAKVDGATFLQELRYITLPLMLPTIVVTLVFRTLVAFKVFDEIYLLTGGGPGTATEVVSYTIYRRFFTEGQMGYGSAHVGASCCSRSRCCSSSPAPRRERKRALAPMTARTPVRARAAATPCSLIAAVDRAVSVRVDLRGRVQDADRADDGPADVHAHARELPRAAVLDQLRLSREFRQQPDRRDRQHRCSSWSRRRSRRTRSSACAGRAGWCTASC